MIRGKTGTPTPGNGISEKTYKGLFTADVACLIAALGFVKIL